MVIKNSTKYHVTSPERSMEALSQKPDITNKTVGF